jgi:hypothetical protein
MGEVPLQDSGSQGQLTWVNLYGWQSSRRMQQQRVYRGISFSKNAAP